MKDDYDALFHKHRQSGIFVDTNILLLYFVGIVDESLVSRFKRTANKFCVEDYHLLCNLLPYFSKIVTTPHILTEVSNLAGQLSGQFKEEFFLKFAKGISLFDEHYTCSADIAKTSAFTKFGIADAGIACLKTYLVLTEDASLAWYLQSQEVDVINFNHIRTFNW